MPATEPSVVSASSHRKILVFGEDYEIQKLLRVFMKKLDGKNAAATDGQLSLAKLNRRDFDGVLLDLRCSNHNRRSKDGVGVIKSIQPSLMGRVLAITVEVSDPKSLELVERYLAGDLPRSLLWLFSDS
jgi:DNA-binding response OmpR family regulator